VGIKIIISVFNLSDDRFINLLFILNSLKKIGIDESDIYLIEQESKNTLKKKNIDKLLNVNYISYTLDDKVFQKSKLINTFVNNCNFEILWFLDADVYLNYKYVLNNLPNNLGIVRPYKEIVLLSENETKFLLETEKLKLEERNCRVDKSFGKYSFIVNKELFISLGGMTEEFLGWGFQDLEFISRIPDKYKTGFTEYIAFHLHHERSPLTFYDENKKLYKNNILNKKHPKKIKRKIIKKTLD